MKNLFAKLSFAAVAGGLLLSTQPAQAQGTAFTYEGQLANHGLPATGQYDFTFALFNNNGTASGQVGSTVTNFAVGVTNGLFTTTLDFGSVFAGAPTWLAIGVRTNGSGAFTALTPLQALTPVPYAISAANAQSVAAANLTGTFALGQLPAAVVTNGASGVTVSGAFSGSGAGLTNVALLAGGNTFTGSQAISGGSLSVNGSLALYLDANQNSYEGGAGNTTTTGSLNTGGGFGALGANTTGYWNTADGQNALGANTTGSQNVAIGTGTMAANTNGSGNVAVGMPALASNTSGGGTSRSAFTPSSTTRPATPTPPAAATR